MIRLLVTALALLHLGPAIAFGLVAFGCDGIEPALGNLCGESSLRAFAFFTAVAWAVLGAGWFIASRLRRSRPPAP